jgi:hypothetical protein
VSLMLPSEASPGIDLRLRVRTTIAWGTQDGILRFALTGNTAGMRSLLELRAASLFDIDPKRGRTALHVSFIKSDLGLC